MLLNRMCFMMIMVTLCWWVGDEEYVLWILEEPAQSHKPQHQLLSMLQIKERKSDGINP